MEWTWLDWMMRYNESMRIRIRARVQSHKSVAKQFDPTGPPEPTVWAGLQVGGIFNEFSLSGGSYLHHLSLCHRATALLHPATPSADFLPDLIQVGQPGLARQARNDVRCLSNVRKQKLFVFDWTWHDLTVQFIVPNSKNWSMINDWSKF